MIADVYDAMRSQRKYQQAFPTERILVVLNAAVQRARFDQHLVRRFVQMLGVYPPGTLVRLNTGEVGVVVRVHASDPYRPRVRVLFASDGARSESTRVVDLWETDPAAPTASTIVAPVDPGTLQVDPLSYM
jgi:flavin-dependent dehydrogenase